MAAFFANSRTLSPASVAVLPLLEGVYLSGNPFKCDCELQPLIVYLQAQSENNETLHNNRFQVNADNVLVSELKF